MVNNNRIAKVLTKDRGFESEENSVFNLSYES